MFKGKKILKKLEQLEAMLEELGAIVSATTDRVIVKSKPGVKSNRRKK